MHIHMHAFSVSLAMGTRLAVVREDRVGSASEVAVSSYLYDALPQSKLNCGMVANVLTNRYIYIYLCTRILTHV